MIEKHPYKSIITFSIFIGIILSIILINPITFFSSDFTPTYNESQFKDVDLSTNSSIITYVENKNRYLSDIVLSSKQRGELTEEQADEIIMISIEAKRTLSSYNSNAEEQDLSTALFYTQQAISLRKIYPFNNCAEEVYNLSKKYKLLFYYLSYKDRNYILDIYETKGTLENFLGANRVYREDFERLPNRVKDVENIEDRYDLYELDCKNFKEYLQEDYKRQKSFFLIKLILIIIIFIAGLILGNFWSKRKSIGKKSEKFGNHLKKMFSPKTIEDDTIKSILKISSVSTTLVAFLGIALTISGFNTWFVVGLILVSVLSLLLSILLGVVSLNNREEIYKKWCYWLFVFGLGFFIFFFVYLLVGGIIVEFLKAIGESAQTYLSNEIVIK